MKVTYETETVPFIGYNYAIVYLDTGNEELYVYGDDDGAISWEVSNNIDFSWDVDPELVGYAYNEMLDDIKPYAEKLLKHHIVDWDEETGMLDDVGNNLYEEIESIIGRYSNEERDTWYHVWTVDPYRMDDDDEVMFNPLNVSPSKLKEIAENEVYDNGIGLMYMDGKPKEFEESSLYRISLEVDRFNTFEDAMKYLRAIKTRYEKDGYGNDFYTILLPYLEKEGVLESENGEWYFYETYDDDWTAEPLRF